MEIDMYESRVKHTLDMDKIPEKLRDEIYDLAIDDEYSIFDYEDGDFKYEIDLNSDKNCIKELRKLLPEYILEENSFAIAFYQ